tara:strand:- start:210 stop:872 length:663 start_codon:yes stop_codon:yes gene_type:complete
VIKAIIFDFDGVITESVGVKTEGFAKLYEPYGKTVVNQVLKNHYANGGVSRYDKFRFYHRKFLGSDMSDDELKNLSRKFSEFVVDRIVKAPYVRGAHEFLKSNQRNYDLFISTGTPQDEIELITKSKGIDSFFKTIYGSSQNKSVYIEKIITTNYYKTDQVVFVGDSIHDKIAAEKNKLTIIARLNENNSPLLSERYMIIDLKQLDAALKEVKTATEECS